MDVAQAQACWEKMKAVIKEQLGDVRYNSWFADLKLHSADGSTLVLYHNQAFNANYVNTRYRETLYNLSPSYFGKDFKDVIVLAEKDLKNWVLQQENSRLNPKYTFDSFVVGQSNRLAHAASLAVAEFPGSEYNPLFIYGGAGLGKTHLMTAIANYVLQNNPETAIEFSNSEKFTNEVVDAIRQKRMAELRSRMRSVDILFIDDIQFLSNRTATQEEFFNTFNELYSAGKQIVISSDRPPDEIATLEERMRSRFKSGIVVDIGKPDVETRMAILRTKAVQENIRIEEGAIALIAERIDTNIRELEGSLSNASLLAKVENSDFITEDIAARSIKDVKPVKTAKSITIEDVINTVSRRYGVSTADILSAKRNREVMIPRQIAMYLAREICSASTTRIGEIFGRDHSTVLHACEKAEEMIRDSREASVMADEIRFALREER